MWENNILKLGFSIHSNPGIFALLLGSGVSRDAGIPTGWEIVGDLINKLAFTQKLIPDPDPYIWYKNYFGEEPDYSKILDKITTTPIERATLLKSYFEPSEEEKEQGLKIPTPAHRNIAKLVKYGYIRMILTTNFDRLLEKALEEENTTPVVISNDDALEGALPYIHSKCTLIKLNGDYMDTRIKNTSEELKSYSEKLNSLLDRIFDEFGLIICGWSGEWDTALRNAILRIKNRRFPMYWLTRGEITEKAKSVIQHRQAEVINIESANKFFIELCEKIDSLREFERPHPLSYNLVKVTVKRYLSEEKFKIKLFDLINDESEEVFNILSSERFNIQVIPNKELFSKRMHEYEESIKILIGMSTQIAYFDEKGDNAYIFKQVIERISNPKKISGGYYEIWINLQHYPLLLLIYAIGIVALVKENWKILKTIFLDPVYRDRKYDERLPILKYINIPNIFSNSKSLIPRDNAEREYTPANNYIFEFLYEYVKEFIPDKEKYEDIFDIFEFLLGLIYIYSTIFLYSNKEQEEVVKTIKTKDYLYAPVGRFAWKYFIYDPDPLRIWQSSIVEFFQNGLKQEKNWGLLKEGFFNNSVEVFNLCLEKYINFLTKRS